MEGIKDLLSCKRRGERGKITSIIVGNKIIRGVLPAPLFEEGKKYELKKAKTEGTRAMWRTSEQRGERQSPMRKKGCAIEDIS